MYNLLIVDDEQIVFRSISHIVENSVPGIHIIGYTGSGTEAVMLAETKKPDIILMDIELIGVNGLEAVEEIKKILPESVVIIISAYDNFHYAKKSIELGVMDYLLKPFTKDDIINILNKARAYLEEKRIKVKEQLELKERLRKIKPYLEEEFLLSLLYPGVVIHNIGEYRHLLEYTFSYGTAVALSSENRERMTNIYGQYRKTVKHYLSDADVVLFSPVIGRMSWVLIGYRNLPGNRRREWKEIADRLLKDLQLETTVVLGRIYPGFDGMILSFQELKEEVHFYTLPSGVFEPGEIQGTNEGSIKFPWHLEQEFFKAVREGRAGTAAVLLSDLFRMITNFPEVDYQAVKDYFHGIGFILFRILLENRSEQFRELKEMDRFLYGIKSARNINELRTEIEENVYTVATGIKNLSEKNKYPEVTAAVNFIKSHYKRDLTLAEIAAAVSVSPGHLSKLFKEEKDQTVMGYLEEVRIEKAINYLKETGLSIKEISYRVGYKDPNYFSKVFKKNTGLSPTAVRTTVNEGRTML